MSGMMVSTYCSFSCSDDLAQTAGRGDNNVGQERRKNSDSDKIYKIVTRRNIIVIKNN